MGTNNGKMAKIVVKIYFFAPAMLIGTAGSPFYINAIKLAVKNKEFQRAFGAFLVFSDFGDR